MSLITEGLIYNLDASVLPLSGFTDQQSLLNAFIPDQVDPDGWYGSAGYDLRLIENGQNGLPVIRFTTGNLTFKDPTKILQYSDLTVLIAAKRTGYSYTGTYMGLFSTWFAYGKAGVSIFAVINNNNQAAAYDYWGTYGGITTIGSTSAMPVDIPMVVGVTVNNETEGTFYTNGSESGTFSNSKTQAYFGVGGLESAEGFFVGDLYQVLIYGKKLNNSQIYELSIYLANKWYNAPLPTPTPSVTPTVTPTFTPSVTPSYSITPTPTVTSTITPTPTLTITPTSSQLAIDVIKSALSGADLTAYNNAAENDWIKISAGNYNNVFVTLSNTTKYGVTDEQVNTRDLSTSYANRDLTFDSMSSGIPSNSYLIGFIAEPWNQNGAVKIGYTTEYKGIPVYISPGLPITGGVRNYYIRKAPSNTDFAPATQTLYPALFMTVSPNGTLNTNGWNSTDNGITWTQNILNITTAKIQLFTTTTKQW